MSSKRHRRRNKQANDRLRDQAVQAAADGRLDRAREILLDLIARVPSNARYRVDLGRVELRAGREEEAVRYFTRALELSPSYTSAAQELAALGRDLPEGTAPSTTPDPPDWPEPADVRRSAAYYWDGLDELLTRQGLAELPDLLTPSELEELTAAGWGTRRTLDDGASEGALEQLPETLEALRAELLWRVAAIGEHWRGRLSGPMPAPTRTDLAETSRIELEAGAPPLPWPKPPGSSPYPLELVVPLEGRVAIEASDALPGKRRKVWRIEAVPGSGLLVAAGERPVQIGGIWARQGLRVWTVSSDERRLLWRSRLG